MGLIQTVEGLNRAKRPARGNSPADCLRNSFIPWVLLHLQDASFQSGIAPAALMSLHLLLLTANFRLVSLHNHMSQFFIRNLFLYMYTYAIDTVSMENPN